VQPVNLNTNIMNIDYKYLINYLTDSANVEDMLTYYFEDDTVNLSKDERDNIADDITTVADRIANLIELNKFNKNI
jgi:hypothetical protein